MSDDDLENGWEGTTTDRKEDLWQAFLSGFATGRKGRYYASLPAISQRAARTEFEQFYESSMREE